MTRRLFNTDSTRLVTPLAFASTVHTPYWKHLLNISSKFKRFVSFSLVSLHDGIRRVYYYLSINVSNY